MALVTRDELKTTLGIGDLYSNTVVDQVIDSAQNVVLSLVARDRHAITTLAVTTSVEDPGVGTIVVITTAAPHGLTVDTQIRLTDIPRTGFTNLLANVTAVGAAGDSLTAALTTVLDPGVSAAQPLEPNGVCYREAGRTFYDTVPEVREAALAIAVDIFQSRVAPGGQTEGIDFQPGPYRLGRSMLSRVSGLLGRWMDTGSLVG